MPLRTGGLILHCRDVRKRQSTACTQPMEACPCIAAEVDISAQSRTGLPLQISETYMRLTRGGHAAIGELRLSDLSLVGWGANRDWRE